MAFNYINININRNYIYINYYILLKSSKYYRDKSLPINVIPFVVVKYFDKIMLSTNLLEHATKQGRRYI